MLSPRDEDFKFLRGVIERPNRRQGFDFGLIGSRRDDDGYARQAVAHGAKATMQRAAFKVQSSLVHNAAAEFIRASPGSWLNYRIRNPCCDSTRPVFMQNV